MISLNIVVHTPDGDAVINWRMVQRIAYAHNGSKRLMLLQSGQEPLELLPPTDKPADIEWTPQVAWTLYERAIAAGMNSLQTRQRLALPE